MKFCPGEYIPDTDNIKKITGNMPEKYQKKSLMDFYREYDWGVHFHIYNWYDITYENGITVNTVLSGKEKTITYNTLKGNLSRKYRLAADGSYCPREYLVKCAEDFDVLFEVIRSQRFVLKEDNVKQVLAAVGDRGQADLAVARSPFGKLVHEYLGFEETVYFMVENMELFERYFELQQAKDMELLQLACQSSARLVIISDHADENLISPVWYEKYCIPFYQRACELLHSYNKIVSTHLDGNIKGLLPILKNSGFDVLDGCTPAPMFNYEPEELAAALSEDMTAFVGVPASMFVEGYSQQDINDYAKRLVSAFNGKFILNVGDILSENGDIEKVIELGNYIKKLNKELEFNV